jgi:hypothetical protein
MFDIRKASEDTHQTLGGYSRQGPNYLHHDDFGRVVDIMQGIADARHGPNARLASGVGNDMSYSFYVRDSLDSVRFYPDGIRGGMITLANVDAR